MPIILPNLQLPCRLDASPEARRPAGVTSGEAARKITLVTIKKTAHEKSLALRVTGLQRVT